MIFNTTQSTHIWYQSFKDEHLLSMSKLYALLDKKEQDKANRFLNPTHTNNYIIAHAYLRLLLSKYVPTIQPSEWEFSLNAYGKPSLSKVHNINLYFNLSHTHHTMAIIFNKICECGIDIEEDNTLIIDENICNIVLSEREKLLYHNSQEKKTIFYKLWTLKEAYSKAVGMGLELPMQTNDFGFIKNLHLFGEHPIIKNNYQCATITLDKNQYLAYAIKQSSNNTSKQNQSVTLFPIHPNVTFSLQ